MDTVQIGIGVFLLCLCACVVIVIVYMRRGGTSPTQTPSASLPSTKPRPFLSAKVKAVKTGDSKVSGYSFDRGTEYATGTCTFVPSMNKYVSLNVELEIDTNDIFINDISIIKAEWKVGSMAWSNVYKNDFSPQERRVTLTLPANTTDTSTNIACTRAGTNRDDNTVVIYYLSPTTDAYELWGTINLESLGTSITTAFETIQVGTGTQLGLNLNMDNLTERIPEFEGLPSYTLTRKSDNRVIVGGESNPVFIEPTQGYENFYNLLYDNLFHVVKLLTIELPSFAGYTLIQVVYSRADPYSDLTNENQDKFISFRDGSRDSEGGVPQFVYKDTYDDECFFLIELYSRDCIYSTTGWEWGACPETCTGAPVTATKRRPLVAAALGAGTCPPAPSETYECTNPRCTNEDCYVPEDDPNWKNMSTCSATRCGTRGEVQQYNDNGRYQDGTSCRKIRMHTCYAPIYACVDADCVASSSDWMVYQPCNATRCGTTGTVGQYTEGLYQGGGQFETESSRRCGKMRTIKCAAPACPVCNISRTEISGCSAEGCSWGTGTRISYGTYQDGTTCIQLNLSERVPCTGPCTSSDCQNLGPPTSTTPCTVTACGQTGTQTNTRTGRFPTGISCQVNEEAPCTGACPPPVSFEQCGSKQWGTTTPCTTWRCDDPGTKSTPYSGIGPQGQPCSGIQTIPCYGDCTCNYYGPEVDGGCNADPCTRGDRVYYREGRRNTGVRCTGQYRYVKCDGRCNIEDVCTIM